MRRIITTIGLAGLLAVSLFVNHDVGTAKPVQACGYQLLSASPVTSETVTYRTGIGGYNSFTEDFQVALYYDCSGDVYGATYAWATNLSWPYPQNPVVYACADLYAEGSYEGDGSGGAAGYSITMTSPVINLGPGSYSYTVYSYDAGNNVACNGTANGYDSEIYVDYQSTGNYYDAADRG